MAWSWCSSCPDCSPHVPFPAEIPSAHGAAERDTQKYANGPIQACMVSRPARAVTRHRVRAKRRSLEDIAPHWPLLAEIWRPVGLWSTPRLRMGPQSVSPKSTQMVLYNLARCRAPRARRCDLGCARNEDLSKTLDLMCLSSSRSRDPSGRANGPERARVHRAWHPRVRKWSYTSLRGVAPRTRVGATSGERKTKISRRHWT